MGLQEEHLGGGPTTVVVLEYKQQQHRHEPMTCNTATGNNNKDEDDDDAATTLSGARHVDWSRFAYAQYVTKVECLSNYGVNICYNVGVVGTSTVNLT